MHYHYYVSGVIIQELKKKRLSRPDTNTGWTINDSDLGSSYGLLGGVCSGITRLSLIGVVVESTESVDAALKALRTSVLEAFVEMATLLLREVYIYILLRVILPLYNKYVHRA